MKIAELASPSPRTTFLVRHHTLNQALRAGETSAEVLGPLVLDELRTLAGSVMRTGPAAPTLQPTVLVHDVLMKLADDGIEFDDAHHFYGIAARAMRQLLAQYARARRAKKRGGDLHRITLNEPAQESPSIDFDIEALDEALDQLQQENADYARIVELRFFVGLSEKECAEVLGLSTRTVERRWKMAKTWLNREIRKRTES